LAARKKSNKELKRDAIDLVLKQGYTQANVAKQLGVNANMLGRWIKEYQSDDDKAFFKKCAAAWLGVIGGFIGAYGIAVWILIN
jgi:transposase